MSRRYKQQAHTYGIVPWSPANKPLLLAMSPYRMFLVCSMPGSNMTTDEREDTVNTYSIATLRMHTTRSVAQLHCCGIEVEDLIFVCEGTLPR